MTISSGHFDTGYWPPNPGERDEFGEMTEPIHADDVVYGLQRRWDALMDLFARGRRVDTTELAALGTQIARTIAVVQGA